MAIFEEQITDTIEAGAPSIKYSEGDIQRQAPENNQERMMAQQIWESLGPEQKAQFITFEQFYTSGAWKQILAQMQQQQAQQEQPMAYGGIAGMGGRRRYGLGSRLRKLIPNEIAKVAEVAAPFVAPFNPIAAGLMGGLGSYDRTGKLGGALKSGLMTYGGGQLARGIGGGLGNLQKGIDPRTGMQGMGSGLTKYFSNPMQSSGGLGKWLDKRKAAKLVGDVDFHESDYYKTGKELSKARPPKGLTEGLMEVVKSKTGLAILGSMAAAYGVTAKDYKPDEIIEMARGKGMDIAGIRKEVEDAFLAGEDAWNELKKKYPYIGDYSDKKAEGGRIGLANGGDPFLMEEYKKYVFEMEEMGIAPMSFEEFKAQAKAGMAQGGRIGAQEGGLMDLGGMEKDYRQEGGFVPLGGKEKADDVPARLSKNEFVFTADAVRNAGGGDVDKGAEVMENVMENLEQGGQISKESQGLGGAQEMFEVSERLSEVV